MARLNPKEAAYAANAIYEVRKSIASEVAIKDFSRKFQNKFEFDTSGRFQGTSGGYILKSSTGFGLIAKGVKGTSFENHAMISIRGTNTVFDGLTDFNLGMRMSKSGNMIHAGFDRSFKSFKDKLTEFFLKNSVTHVHLIGHSLGGALATLTADWVRYNKFARTTLYTFGCPRVGSADFARNLTRRIREENIYRVYHRSDPVPMVPVWPFVHLPLPGTDCYIEDAQMVPWINKHSMAKYGESVSNVDDWSTIKQNQLIERLDHQIKTWLQNVSLPVALYIGPFYMIGAAISYIIKKALGLGVITIQAGISTSLTAIDQLAIILNKAYRVSKELSGYVLGLLKRILAFLGMSARMVADITTDFIRWVLMSLTRMVYRAARLALSALPTI